MKLTTFLRTAKPLFPLRYAANAVLRSRAADRAINLIMREPPKGKELRRLKSDMIREKSLRYFTFEEYLLYRFQTLSKSERKKYVSDYERVFFIRKVNRAENEQIFNDKALTYQCFKKYYRRDVVKVVKKDEETFNAFVSKHPRFIAKPIDDSFGNGVKLFETPPKWSDFSKEYRDGAVIEEVITQSEPLSRIHPQSVNTIRITTMRLDDEVRIFYPFMRVGCGNRVVDNGGAGGIICGIDLSSGIVTYCKDEKGSEFLIHPDTGVQLIGMRIPRWKEAVELSKELASVLPDNRYTGWDLALTDDGWVMVEGNCLGQYIGCQMTHRTGVRPALEKYYSALDIPLRIK